MKKLLAFGSSLLLALSLSMPVWAGSAADEILIANPYVRAVPAMMENSAAFMTLKNTGTVDRAVVSAASRAAKVVELHTHVKDGEVMRMRQIDKIGVAAGRATVLEPGGLHVMLLGLKRPLAVGSTVQVDLTFDDGSTKAVVAPVRAVQGMHSDSGHGEHTMHSGGAPSESASPVFVNLTSDDEWRASMALHWAQMAMRRGHKVTVFLNVDGVRLAVASIAHPLHAMHEESAQDAILDVISGGGTVYVCGGCLKRAGFRPSDLIDGVQMGSPDKLMPAIFDPAAKVISW